MLRSFEYRLYPSMKEEARLYSTFHLCSEMYYLLLTEHEAAYEQAGISLTRYDLNNRITNIKQDDARFKSVYSQVLQNQADRLSKAFNDFFRRCRENMQGAGIKVGYPRYTKLVHSITYPQNNGSFKLVSNKLNVSKIGKIPIVLHRPIIGTMKTLTIKRNRAGHWFAVFCCEVEMAELTHSGPTVGLDQGLKSFIVGSDGLVVEDLRNNHSLAKSFSDAGLSSFITMLEHKVSETGAQLVKVNPAFTTQTFSRCGRVKEEDEKLGLGDREYRCPCCGLVIDRDLNASMNMHRAGLARIHACGDDVRHSHESAIVAEPGTIRFG